MKILIIGGGMGGTILANNLARRLSPEMKSGKAKITMVTASEKHMYQPGLLYLAFGRMTPDELYKDQATLLEPGITLVVDPIEEFLLDQNQRQDEEREDLRLRHSRDRDWLASGARTHSRPR